ncbi:hypothetical protein [Candidatus Schmidhempelia bombi]|jgi:hypothetical protein|uniref:DUF1311 domain-containing protein n=1 Tax=Candidatus Schmidhempelia bombi str. Bimp TaxID=1387197 RepID=A0AB94IEB6_9GAMM|nr:hypothetical protein [Candidatus Schmidhempelia bombi]TEA27808.1 hypothetical protein O970_01985 [Candidatus Schmidhempelia bombi str. Bimp]
MKISLYFVLILPIFSFYAHSQQFDVTDSYKGISIIESIDMEQLKQDCQAMVDWQFSNTEREENKAYCPINQIDPYFSDLYEAVNKDVVIYDKSELKFVINKQYFNKTFNDNNYPVKGLNLSLVYQGTIKDTITLANISYDVVGYYWLSNQYYYINPNGNIYTLLVKDFGRSIQPIFWKNYQIDKENLRFRLKALFVNEDRYQYRIIYPDQFDILTQSQSPIFETEKLKSCYQDEYNTTCNVESYNYYHDLLVKKLTLLQKNESEQKNAIKVIDKQINEACLVLSSPIYYNEVDTFTHKITRCLTEQIKQQIEKIVTNKKVQD